MLEVVDEATDGDVVPLVVSLKVNPGLEAIKGVVCSKTNLKVKGGFEQKRAVKAW